ncbi:glycosyltransferase family 2 protein [Parapedobacter tibetensis]|nr:glycosyltransferase [Parapedobacter tibetensis]
MYNENNTVTVILTVWKRNHLEEQIESMLSQTVTPNAIWVYQCKNYVDVSATLAKFPFVEHLHSSVDLKYFGRFSLARYVKTNYVWILDDDVIPSSNWLIKSLQLCEKENAIISSAGRIIPKGDYFPERLENVNQFFFGDVPRQGSQNLCFKNTVVDFGCNGWLFKRQWLDYFWSASPFTLETAEDMHLSAMCKIKAGIRTIVPKQTSEETSGNLKIQYGLDEYASWLRGGFFDERNEVLHYLIDHLAWRPLLWERNLKKEVYRFTLQSIKLGRQVLKKIRAILIAFSTR